MKNRNVIWLIGMSGSGKTTIGKLLATRLDATFYDTDDLICKKNELTIKDIFELKGESFFRSEEAKVFDNFKFKTNEKYVIATGGGFVTNDFIFNFLLQNYTVIYLNAKPEIAISRVVKSEARPLLMGKNNLKDWENIFNVRRSIYEKADYIISANSDSNAVCRDILKILKLN